VKCKALIIGLSLVIVAGCGSSAMKPNPDTATTKPYLCPDGSTPTTEAGPGPFHYQCNSSTYIPLPSGGPTTAKP
jgi:hypothetical protein